MHKNAIYSTNILIRTSKVHNMYIRPHADFDEGNIDEFDKLPAIYQYFPIKIFYFITAMIILSIAT